MQNERISSEYYSTSKLKNYQLEECDNNLAELTKRPKKAKKLSYIICENDSDLAVSESSKSEGITIREDNRFDLNKPTNRKLNLPRIRPSDSSCKLPEINSKNIIEKREERK